MLLDYVKILWQDFVLLIYPKVCVHCNQTLVKSEDHLCISCASNIPSLTKTESDSAVIKESFVFLKKLESAQYFLPFLKRGIARSVLHSLKYRGNYEIGVFFGDLFARNLNASIYKNVDFIIPVPIHVKKEKIRGYNQSEAIATGIGNFLDIPVRNDLIKRVRNKKSQTSKSKSERWRSLQDIYEISKPQEVQKKEIVLVDDVITTGATMAYLAELLEDSGVRKLHILTLASGKVKF